MKSENIEQILKKIGREDVPTEAHKIAEETSENFSKTLTPSRQHILWEHIMKSKITKLAAAAVIIIAVAFGLSTLFDQAVTPAYAIEQTVEAIRHANTIHIFGRDWQNRRIEMWVKVNPDTAFMEYCYLDELDAGKLMISTPENTYYYDKESNAVRIKDGPGVRSVFRLGQFIEDMVEVTGRLKGIVSHHEVFDPDVGRDVIVLKMISSQLDLKALIDPETKLPISVNVIRGQKPGSYEIFKHADQIYYGELLPMGLFDFRIPEGADVVRETIEDAGQRLPESVIEYAVLVHVETIERETIGKGIPANSHIYVVDEQFNLTGGGFIGIYNYSKEIWSGEVPVGNFDRPNLALFDENGKKQKIRMVQRKSFSPGKFRLYWFLDEPLHPGQARGGFYWYGISNARQLTRRPDSTYSLRMNNFYGAEVVETFFLILPSGIKIQEQSEDYTSHEEIEGFDIYVWQKHIPRKQDNTVDVVLKGEGL